MTDFTYCLNTSTIQGQHLTLVEEIEITARAGYQGIEPWVQELDALVAEGSSLDDIGARIVDAGLVVENIIGFFEWAVTDPARRTAGLAEARRNLEIAQRIGCKRLAAAPMGITDGGADLRQVAEYYADLLAIGAEYGVTPMLEFWGMSQSLGRMSEALFVVSECGRRDACILADVFHMYKSGGGFASLGYLGARTLGLFHMNDYPATPPREIITDSDRVYPGDGVAPLAQIFADLRTTGYHGALSVELFNPAYYAQDALTVAQTALTKLRAVTERTDR